MYTKYNVILTRSFISTETSSKTPILHDFYTDGEFGNLEALSKSKLT